MKKLLTLFVLSAIASLTAVAGGVDAGYKTPRVTVPYAWRKPEIDGVIKDAEWRGAASVNALQTTRRQVIIRAVKQGG